MKYANVTDHMNNVYFAWLCDEIYVDPFGDDHTILLRQLHATIFSPTLPGDENRESDGEDLRVGFEDDTGMTLPLDILTAPCSCLEMLVALGKRMWYITDGFEFPVYNLVYKTQNQTVQYSAKLYNTEQNRWFWEIICVNGLIEFSDDTFRKQWIEADLDTKLTDIVQKRAWLYNYCTKNCTVKVTKNAEIWYQMHEYLAKMYDF